MYRTSQGGREAPIRPLSPSRPSTVRSVDVDAVFPNVVLAGKLLGADGARVADAVLVQMALHVPPQAARVVEGPLAVAAPWVAPAAHVRRLHGLLSGPHGDCKGIRQTDDGDTVNQSYVSPVFPGSDLVAEHASRASKVWF